MKARFKIRLLLLITVYGQILLEIASGNVIIRVNSSRTIPAMARKAGGTWKTTPAPETSSDKLVTATERTTGSYSKHENADTIGDILTSSKSFEEYEYSDSSEEMKEIRCSRGMFWHIRGLRCVPLECPELRDKDTGECYNYPTQRYFNSQPFYRRYRIRYPKTKIWRGRK